MQKRRKVGFITLIIIGLLIGFAIKRVALGLVLGLLLGLLASGMVASTKNKHDQ
ncbi:hypothetical protein [Segetibacter sp. 3557_3]|uniref:hypothetical protein n=1 Tax=Segetibacter sp. 3557_3 TaxID=2547429 RepID=UPI001404B036|nr:hypothetical protein [Segetibacter sp. 3557_3]